jgi:hypothetical protein
MLCRISAALCGRVRRSVGELTGGRRAGRPQGSPREAPGNNQDHAPPAPSFPRVVIHHGRHTR